MDVTVPKGGVARATWPSSSHVKTIELVSVGFSGAVEGAVVGVRVTVGCAVMVGAAEVGSAVGRDGTTVLGGLLLLSP